ncbi:MAG: hypothetical protein RLZZ383_2228 [Pseudomonadota bacterium]
MSGEVVPFPSFGEPVRQAPIPPDVLVAMLEALLFAAGEPVTVLDLAEAIGAVDVGDVLAGLEALEAQRREGGVRLVRVAGGWQLRTDPAFSDEVARLRGGRPQKMSNAALETLAVVAYRQPCTRQEVDDLRGVSAGGVLKTLLDKGYLRVVGRREEPGRPLEYGTTPLFLEMFQLDSLASLPTLQEREELAATDPAEGGAGTTLEVPVILPDVDIDVVARVDDPGEPR